MDLPTYTNIWRIEKRLYKLYDLRLPMPLPIVWIGVFVGVLAPWSLLLYVVGVPIAVPWHVLYLVPPGIVTWLSTRPVIENKRLTELMESHLRYLGEPRTWTRMAPVAEPETITFSGRVWRVSPTTARVKAPRKARATQRKRQPVPARAGVTAESLSAGSVTAGGLSVGSATAGGLSAAAASGVDVASAGASGVAPGGVRPSGAGDAGAAASTGARAVQPAVAAAAAAAAQAPVTAAAQGPAAEATSPRRVAAPRRGAAPALGASALPQVKTPAEETFPVRHAPPTPQPSSPPVIARIEKPTEAAPIETPTVSHVEPPAAKPDVREEAPSTGKPIDTEALRRLRKLAATAPADTDAPAETPKSPTPVSAVETPKTVNTPEVVEVVESSEVVEVAQGGETSEVVETAPVVEAAEPGVVAAEVPVVEAKPVVDDARLQHRRGQPPRQATSAPQDGQRVWPPTPRDNTPHTPRDSKPHTPDDSKPHTPGDNKPPTPRDGKPPIKGVPSAPPGAAVPPAPLPDTRKPAQQPGVTAVSAAIPPAAAATRPSADASDDNPTQTGTAAASGQSIKGQGAPASSQTGAPASGQRGVPASGLGGVPASGQGGQPASGQSGLPVSGQGGQPASGQGGVPGPRAGEREGRVRRVESVVGRGDSGGWRRIAQVVVGGGSVRGDGSEIDEARARAVFGGSRRIVVLGCTGGAGQSTTALMLGHTLANYRDDRVLAVDANTGGNTLTSRIKADSPETLTSLLSGLDRISGYLTMRAYTTRTTSGLEVIGADTEAGAEQRLADRSLFSEQRMGQAMHLLDRHYKLAVIDPAAALAARILPYADQLVLVVPASEDAAEAVAMTYEWLDGHGCADLRRRAVMVVNGVSRRSMADVEQAEAVARGRCRAIVRVPWEDELAAGETVDPGQLRAPGRRAYLALAGVVVAGFAAAQAVRPSEEELASDPPGTRIGER